MKTIIIILILITCLSANYYPVGRFLKTDTVKMPDGIPGYIINDLKYKGEYLYIPARNICIRLDK